MKKAFQIMLSLSLVMILLLGFSNGHKTVTAINPVKDTSIVQCANAIEGLYEGTYTVGAAMPVPDGTQFYFSFSIYPGGRISYKSKGYYQGGVEYITFADGTYTLKGNKFSFTVTTINMAGGGEQHVQKGHAIFNSSNGTLTDGFIEDPLGGTATWFMTKVVDKPKPPQRFS